MTVTLHLGDCVSWARNYSGAPFHALLCDPPYHLTEMTKRYSKPGTNDLRTAGDTPQRRTARGFMGKQWDGGDLAFNPETWAAFGNVLHDGAFGMAFGSSRGYHRLACAIEDAGFIIHPSLFGWAMGSGFPKATNVSAQIDNNWAKETYGGWCDCET